MTTIHGKLGIRIAAVALAAALLVGIPGGIARGESNTESRPDNRPGQVLNLNTATAAELQTLPGIGPAKARAILAYRERRSFRTVAELVRIKGLGRKTVRKLMPHLTVEGTPKPKPKPKPKRKPCDG